MKYLLIVLLIVIGCIQKIEYPIQSLIIIDVYKEDVHANDGVVETDWYTLFQMENGSRFKYQGKYGDKGDTLKNMYIRIYNGDYWIHPKGQNK